MLPFLLTIEAAYGADGPPECKPPCAQPLFVVQRSLNANELVYQANLLAEGFHPRVPLNVYWLMKAKDGAREELTNMERNRAYGIKFLSITPREVRFTVKALEGVLFRAVLDPAEDGSQVRVIARVSGEEMTVEHVFIATKGVGLMPRVISIEFTGMSPSSHARVVHRILPGGAPGEAPLPAPR
ncbi:MAG: DUF4833 domain-containing protein [Thermoanaerobaculia bacterium]